jgi:hypothetical protein
MEKFALKPKLSATLDGVVAQFKHYVENEKPFTGDLATLLRPQAA